MFYVVVTKKKKFVQLAVGVEVDSVSDVEEMEEVVEALPMTWLDVLALGRLPRETMDPFRYTQGTYCSLVVSLVVIRSLTDLLAHSVTHPVIHATHSIINTTNRYGGGGGGGGAGEASEKVDPPKHHQGANGGDGKKSQITKLYAGKGAN